MSAKTRSKNYERMSQARLDSLINRPAAEPVVTIQTEIQTEVVKIIRPPVQAKPVLHSEEEYDSLHPEETFKAFCVAVRGMLAKYETDKAELERLELEMQDLLHYMEMSKNKNANEGFKLYKKMCEVRRLRRICKNEIDLLQPVYELFHGTKMLDQLSYVQGQCHTAKQAIDSRGYSVRTDVLSEFVE